MDNQFYFDWDKWLEQYGGDKDFWKPEEQAPEQGFQPPEQKPFTFEEYGNKFGIYPDKQEQLRRLLGEVPQANQQQQGFQAQQPAIPDNAQETPQDSQGITSQDLAAGARLALDEMKGRANQQPANTGVGNQLRQQQEQANQQALQSNGGLFQKLIMPALLGAATAGIGNALGAGVRALGNTAGGWLGTKVLGTLGDTLSRRRR